MDIPTKIQFSGRIDQLQPSRMNYSNLATRLVPKVNSEFLDDLLRNYFYFRTVKI